MASREEIEARKAAGLCVKAGCGSRAFERWTYCERHLPRSFTLARTIKTMIGMGIVQPRSKRPDSN